MPTFSISSTHEEWWWCQACSERCSAQTTSCSVSRAPATTGQRATTRRAPSWWTRCWTWCNWLQGFQLTHPLGGSTGSGMGTLLISKNMMAACDPCHDRYLTVASIFLFDCQTMYCKHYYHHHPLPHNLRHRAHSLQLPEHSTQFSDSNFITCMLCKNTY